MKINTLWIIIFLILLIYPTLNHTAVGQTSLSVEKRPEMSYNSTGKYYEIHHNSPSGITSLKLLEDKLNFHILPLIENNQTIESFSIELKSELANLYKQVGFSTKSQNTAFVYPLFTQAAYEQHGFYDYYNKKCDYKCLTVEIPSSFNGTYSSSIVGAMVLNILNYSFVTDADIDNNPEILKQYNTIIMLHNEYVTKKEFDAITNHPHVLYLYPNVLYAEIKSNNDNTITLVRGHGYPDEKIQNGFDWKFDNTKFEYDLLCQNWNFTKIVNGKMLNCYPDYALLYDESLLKSLKYSSIENIPEFNYISGIILVIGVIMTILISYITKLRLLK